MSIHAGKYIIGLTGNIATGKSVVRRMLEHLGAYTIDADALAHRAIARDAPGYRRVVESFGTWITAGSGEIDRARLGKIAFTDPVAMQQLESIIHPLVGRAAEVLIHRAQQPVVVIEAVKLLESSLRGLCDSIWVTHAPERAQVERLMRRRGLSREEAIGRIRMQSPQAGKVAAADVAIHNTGSYEDLWLQVVAAWKKIPAATPSVPPIGESLPGQLQVQRGRPRDASEIARLMTHLGGRHRTVGPADVMAEFGDRAYLLLQKDGLHVGLAGWQVENLVARTTDLYLEPSVSTAEGLRALLSEVERASNDLQCEVSLAFPDPALAAQEAVWKGLGYEQRTPESLEAQAWQDAAKESMPSGRTMFFKKLREERILRPI